MTWLLTGNEEKKGTAGSHKNLTIIEHQDVVTRFKNPKKAKEFNEFLIGVEKHNPKGYDNLYELAKSLYESTSEGRSKKKEFSTKKHRASGD